MRVSYYHRYVDEGDAAFLIGGRYLNKGLQLQRSCKPLRVGTGTGRG
jgi:hypothetical protein